MGPALLREVETGALAPTYLCSASRRVNERTVRKRRMPAVRMPATKGRREMAVDKITAERFRILWPLNLVLVGGCWVLRLENLAEDDDARRGADWNVAPPSSSASFTSSTI